MKTTKNLLAAAAMAALLSPTLNSCKKGDGDPFLSLRSRKARVTGEWTVATMKNESSYTNSSESGGFSSSSSGSSLMDINGSTVKITNTDTDDQGNTSIGVGSGGADVRIIFTKEGTFSQTVKLINVAMNYDGDEVVENSTIESSGTWNFLGAVEKDYKNKERLILNYTREVTTTSQSASSFGFSTSETSTNTYANGERSEIWKITTLRNKEMVVEGANNSTGSYTSTFEFGGSSDSDSGTFTEKGTLSATLKQ